MKKYSLLFLIPFLLFSFIGCTNNNDAKPQNIYVSLRDSIDKDNVLYLKWIVENRSENKDSVNFKNGDILNYEIRHHSSGKKYTGKDKDHSDIALKAGESYEKTIKFKDLPEGHYEAEFWAKWAEDKKGTMVVQFDIKR